MASAPPGLPASRNTGGFALGFFFLCTLAAPAVHAVVAPDLLYVKDLVVWCAHGLGLMALVAWMIQGVGRHAVAERLLVWSSFVFVLVAVVGTTEGPYSDWIPFYLLVPVLLAGFLVPPREVLAASIGVLAVGGGATAAGWIAPHVGVNAVVLGLAVAIVMVTNSWIRATESRLIAAQSRDLAQRAQDLDAVIESTQDAIISLDAKGRLVIWNAAAAAQKKPE